MSQAPFHVEKEIVLDENEYNFDIYTYDAQGNRSIPVNISSEAYGESYAASLRNRVVSSFSYSGTTGTVSWYPMDTTLGAFETEVTYKKTSGEDVTVVTPVSENSTVLEDYDGGTVTYRTAFRPDETCVDIFYADPEEMTHD